MARLRPAADPSAADWLLGHPSEWWTLVRYGPPGLPVYVRISFEPAASEGGDAARTALHVLSSCTTTPERCHAAIWEGWAGSEPPQAPIVPIPNRTMLLFEGSVADLRDAPRLAWSIPHGNVTPHLAWPDDRAWCFACEVDEDVAFTVGCSTEAAAALHHALADAVTRTPYGAPQPLYRDEA